MYHCPRRGRGIRIKGDSPTNIIFTRNCSYERMLEKCVNQLGYSEADKLENTYYVADAKGISICKSDTLCVEDRATGEKNIPWTLISYIEYSNVRYPPKAKFYCVAKKCDAPESASAGMESEGSLPEDTEPTTTPAITSNTSTSPVISTPHNSNVNPGLPRASEPVGESATAVTPDPDITNGKSLLFEPVFVKPGINSLRHVCQQSALESCHIDLDEEDESLFYPFNPCHYGYCLGGVNGPGSSNITLVSCCRDGEIIYKQPSGDKWGVWTGGIGSTNVAMLIAVVTGNYHSMSIYRWAKDGEPLEDEVYPVIYPTSTGEYVCSISIKKCHVFLKFSFLVTNTDSGSDWDVQVPSSSHVVGHDNAETPYTFEIANQRLSQLQPLKAKDPNELTLIKVIGQGTFGVVHVASWRGSLVAAKVIPISQTELKNNVVQREIDILRHLHHSNLASCCGVMEGAASVTIISPLIDGKNLQELIFGKERLLLIGEKRYILLQLCQALVFLHTSSPPLAHLDVKPANVMVDSMTLHTVLADFGLARFMSHTSSLGTRTMLAGSPGYQSPEQLRAESTGPPSDVYAFGGVCLITYVSKPLWPGLGMFQIIQKVTNNVKPNTDLLQEYQQGRVKQICDKCFDNVSVRPSSIQVLDALLDTAHNTD